jgi:hypothetical protein
MEDTLTSKLVIHQKFDKDEHIFVTSFRLKKLDEQKENKIRFKFWKRPNSQKN